ncbi:uncharacterized protein LOC123539422 [Mercenaria mercenaria]|uniref:uncharacterized protein LOC123539422 n=1 Tax=Mercenaria mercenaria TaxID=6596 RepID=UPI00234E837B|nr:uncharacterized protein LOC123539422 [Mercenaria mercenaria]
MAYRFHSFLLCLVCASVLRKEHVSAFLWQQSCDQIYEYKALLTNLRKYPCISDTQIWNMLLPLTSISDTCLRQLIRNYAAYTQSHRDAGKNCRCTHDFSREVARPLGNNLDHKWECVTLNPNCKYLFNYFYLRGGQTHEVSRCQPHYHVWTHLRDIKNHPGSDQQSELIFHLSQTYSNGHENVCKCLRVHTTVDVKTTTTTERSLAKMSTDPPKVTERHLVTTNLTNPSTREPVVQTSLPVVKTDRYNADSSTTVTHADKSTTKTSIPFRTTPTATQGPATNSSKAIQSTQLPLNVTSNCQKYMSVSNIAVGKISSHPFAYLCPSGNRTSNEAFVLANCNVDSPAHWIEGPYVMKNCDRIPTYTPLATFGTEYLGIQEHEGLSGIFPGCIPGGFKMAYQDCDTSATIKHIENGNGSGIDDPNNYFVIV